MNFLKKIFSPTCLTISIFLLIYTFYKSEIYFGGLKNDYHLTYYIISSCLIIFSIITFFISQKIKENLIISSISIVFGLYFIEGCLAFYKPKTQQDPQQVIEIKKKLYKKETGKKYDTRTRLEIYEDLKKINSNIKVSAPLSNNIDKNYQIFPLSGISNSETIHCNENGYYSIYQSDRYGFNNPDSEWDKKEIEYLLVGDSLTHGACVNRPNDIASVLRTLSNKSILNLGYGGNGPLIEYATLREYLNSNVKKVLWVYYEGNDLYNLSKELNVKILKNYLNNLTFAQNLKLKQNEINNFVSEIIEREINKVGEIDKEIDKEREIKKERKVDKIFKFIRIYKLRNFLYILISKPQIQIQPEFKKILELAKNLTTKNNSKLYFIYLPDYARYKFKNVNSSYLSVKKIVNELNIPFIDIHSELFEKEKNPLKLFPFSLSSHYNVEGYRKVAESIYKLSKN